MTKEVTAAMVADKALDKTEALITYAADKATDLFTAAAGIISDGIAKFGPQVVEAVLWVVRLDALQQLVTALILTLVGVYLIYIFNFSKTKLNMWQYLKHDDIAIIPIIGSSVIGGILLVINISTLTNVWLYTAMVKPELYLVKKAYDVVEKKLSEKK